MNIFSEFTDLSMKIIHALYWEFWSRQFFSLCLRDFLRNLCRKSESSVHSRLINKPNGKENCYWKKSSCLHMIWANLFNMLCDGKYWHFQKRIKPIVRLASSYKCVTDFSSTASLFLSEMQSCEQPAPEISFFLWFSKVPHLGKLVVKSMWHLSLTWIYIKKIQLNCSKLPHNPSDTLESETSLCFVSTYD